MNREEETLFIRKMQEADKTLLDKHFTLKKISEAKRVSDNHLYTLAEFDVTNERDSGYFNLGFDKDDTIILAEMDVNFKTPLGLNRSPLELKILAEALLFHYKESILVKEKEQ